MRTISLRFSDKFAPEEGTINAHKAIIEQKGYVWYGKFGAPPNKKIMAEVLKNDNSRILLIHSGSSDRYWAQITEYTTEMPPINEMPDYYSKHLDRMKAWFKVISFAKAERDVMSKCVVASSRNLLSDASKHSMSPYFVIEYSEK